MKFTTTATVIAAALASFADPAQARIGGWNGAAAQAAAMVISGFNGGQLNGPSSGPARMNIRNGPAPIVRVIRDEDDFLGGYRNPVFANNRAHNAREGYTSVPAGGRYDSAYYKRHHNPNHYADEDDLDYLGNCNDSDWWRHSYCHTRFRGRDEEEDDSLGHRPTKLCRSSVGRHNECN